MLTVVADSAIGLQRDQAVRTGRLGIDRLAQALGVSAAVW
jgi:hypothetical protein